MERFFTSDPHYGHANIIKYGNRPFANEEIMKKELINNCNSVLTSSSTLYINGDFCLKSATHLNFYKGVLNKIKGRKVLIIGNHDELKPRQYLDAGFHSIHTSLDLIIDGIELTLVHDPCFSIIDRKRLFLCGHIHDLLLVRKNIINVSVEMWNYTPASWEQIKELYNRMIESNFNLTI